MFRFAACVLVFLLSVPAFAVEKNTVFEMSAVGEVQIATDGSVSDYRLQSKLAPELAKIVDHSVRGWHFEPVLVDGKAVIAKTAMRLNLKGIPVGGDNYKIEVVNVIFGEPQKEAHVIPPRYPDMAIRAHVGAKVLLYVKLDDAGKVVDAEPYQTNLDVRTRSEFEAQTYRRLFEEASVRAARDWRYDLTETINGKKMGTLAMVPIVYSLHEMGTRVASNDGQWKGYVSGPVHDSVLGREAKVRDTAQFADLGDGEAQSLSSHFRLRDDVVGKPLQTN